MRVARRQAAADAMTRPCDRSFIGCKIVSQEGRLLLNSQSYNFAGLSPFKLDTACFFLSNIHPYLGILYTSAAIVPEHKRCKNKSDKYLYILYNEKKEEEITRG